MEYQDIKKRLTAAQSLLAQPELSLATLQSVQTLIAGIHPQLDEKLANITRQFSKIHKLTSGQIVELSAELLPERNENEKKRKKALLLFIRSLKDLRSEMTRIEKEMDASDGSRMGQVRAVSRIVAFAKGPLGIITAIAVLAMVTTMLLKNPGKSISYIMIQGHKVTLDQVFIGTGSDCDAPHYHAKNEVSVTAIDGKTLPDPGGCGYGKVTSFPVMKM